MTVLDRDGASLDPASADRHVAADLRLGDVLDRESAPLQQTTSLRDGEVDDADLFMRPPLPMRSIALVAMFAALAAAWPVSRLFAGAGASVSILGLSVAGVLMAALAGRRSVLVQILLPALPVLLVVFSTNSAVGGDLSSAMRDAVESRQLTMAPVQFTPAWQVLCALLLVSAGAASVALALGRDHPRAAVLLPSLVVIGASLIQPAGSELVAIVPAVVLLLLALAAAHAAETSRDAQNRRSFEAGQILRALVPLTAVCAVLVVFAQLGVLTPKGAQSVRAAQPPIGQIAVADAEVLFEVRAPQAVPLRLGVLDSYDGSQWLLPAHDPGSVSPLRDSRLGAEAREVLDTMTVTVTVGLPASGRFAPLPVGGYAVDGLEEGTVYDARTASLRLASAAPRDLSYATRARRSATNVLAGVGLSETTMARHTAPETVQGLLAKAPADSAAARVDHVRRAFFSVVKEQPGGTPVPVSPQRVAEILDGSPATGFETAAAQALLIEWSGAQARVGYGYYAPSPSANGAYEITAKDGAAWPEVRTQAGEWIALVDRPTIERVTAPPIVRDVPNGQRIAEVEIPVDRVAPLAITDLVGYWLVRYLIVAAALLLSWLCIPTTLRFVRRIRRRRWAAERGPAAQVAVAYAELRDTCTDLRIGFRTDTPLELLDAIEPDEDHAELAWLVNRVLWGDLARDVDERDAEAAAVLAQATAKRLRLGQPYLQRIAAMGSYRSLLDPWSTDVPNVLPRWVGRQQPLASAVGPSVRSPWRTRLVAAVIVLALVALPFVMGIRRPHLAATGTERLTSLPAVTGAYALQPVPGAQEAIDARLETSLVAAAQLYAVSLRGEPVGTVQVSAFKGGLGDADNRAARVGVLQMLGMTDVRAAGREIVYARQMDTRTQLLWFAPDGQSMVLLTATSEIENPYALIAGVVSGSSADLPMVVSVPDTRELGMEGAG